MLLIVTGDNGGMELHLCNGWIHVVRMAKQGNREARNAETQDQKC